jgi:hypothetical protein
MPVLTKSQRNNPTAQCFVEKRTANATLRYHKNSQRDVLRKIQGEVSLPARLAGPRSGAAEPAWVVVPEALASVDAVKIEGVAVVACLPRGAIWPAQCRADGSETLAASLVLV